MSWKRRKPAFAGAIAGLVLLAQASPAHHGVSRYDMQSVLTLKGSVETWDWQSPHTSLSLRVHADAGVPVWRIEGAPPRWMEGQGWSTDSLEAGETVIVTYHPARARGGDWDGILMEVERENGEVLKVNRPARLGGP